MELNTNLIAPHVLFINATLADNFLTEMLIKLDKIPIIPHFTNNAFEGLDYLRRLRGMNEFPKYIFVELNMPLIGGFEFVEEFTQNFPEYHTNTNIYIVSTFIRTYEKKRVNDCYIIKDYIERPLESLQLYAITQKDKHE